MDLRRFWLVALVLLVLAPLAGWGRPAPATAAEPTDFAIPGGWFYSQASGRNGDTRWGYRITDEGGIRFWSEFQRLGGVPAVGYPASGRFQGSGFILQATQKFILQWRPEADQVWFLNIFDIMHDAGYDGWLLTVRQVPPPEDTASDAGLTWDQVVARHQAMLDRNPAIRAAYWSDPDPVNHFGLPMAYADLGNVLVLRAQRVVFQQWKEDTPWAQAGQITIANGGDVAKEAGLLPAPAVTPEPSPSSPSSPSSPRPARIRWAYFMKSDPASWASLQTGSDHLDYVSPFYFAVDGRGVVTGTPDLQADQLLRAKGIRILPTFKNGPQGADFQPVLRDPGVRRSTIDQIVRIVEDYRYDGINLDYEGVLSSDRDALTAYVVELAAALHARAKLMTMAVPAKTGDTSTGWAGAFDYPALASQNDLILVMAYGYRVPSSMTIGSVGPHAWVDRVAAYAATQIPAAKLLLGLAWYGYDWNITDRGLTRSVRYLDALALAQRFGAPIEYDEFEQVAHFRYYDGSSNHEVWFEDARSIAAKSRLATKYGLAGIGGWRLGQEDPAIWPILADWSGGN